MAYESVEKINRVAENLDLSLPVPRNYIRNRLREVAEVGFLTYNNDSLEIASQHVIDRIGTPSDFPTARNITLETAEDIIYDSGKRCGLGFNTPNQVIDRVITRTDRIDEDQKQGVKESVLKVVRMLENDIRNGVVSRHVKPVSIGAASLYIGSNGLLTQHEVAKYSYSTPRTIGIFKKRFLENHPEFS